MIRTTTLTPSVLMLVLLSLAPLTIASSATAQAPNPSADAGLVAMQGIDFLVGEWEGSGWMRRGPGEPSHFTSREVVESRLDGRVLIIEGLHYAKLDEAGEAEEEASVVHHAVAMVTYDEAEGYRFRSHLDNGRSGDYRGSLEEGRFVWGMEVPGGHTRYTISVEGGVWHEVGEFSRDGQEWSQFFEMTLDRLD